MLEAGFALAACAPKPKPKAPWPTTAALAAAAAAAAAAGFSSCLASSPILCTTPLSLPCAPPSMLLSAP